MQNPERGAGWEIVREFVDPEKAIRAGEQVLDLVTSDSPYMSEYPSSQERVGQKGLSFYRFHGWNIKDFPKYPETITEDPEAREEAADLIDIHRRAAKIIKPDIGAAQVNVFEPGGHTRRHRDRYNQDSFVISLLGVGLASIRDLATNEIIWAEVNPGDAMKIFNPRAQRDRPMHQVRNVGEGYRVSIVE